MLEGFDCNRGYIIIINKFESQQYDISSRKDFLFSKLSCFY